MNRAIEVVTLKPQPTVIVRAEVSRAELGMRLAQVLPRAFQHAMKSGAQATGMPFTRYLRVAGEQLSIEAGVPVTKTVAANGDVVASELPGGRAVKTVHVGPYDTLPATHAALKAWATSNGEKPRDDAWEIYVTDPSTQPDPQKWETEVYLPLR